MKNYFSSFLIMESSIYSIQENDLINFLKQNIRFKEIVNLIISQKIIANAAQERGITVLEDEIQQDSENWRRLHKLEKADDVFKWLEDQQITPEDWEEGIRKKLLADKLASHLFANEINKYFLEHQLDYQQVSLYQILIENEEKAQELFFQIEDQEISFYQAAQMYDIDENRRLKFGYEGKVFRQQLPANLREVIFAAQVGEVTPPVQTDLGYHLFLVQEFITLELTPALSKEIQAKLFQEWLGRELQYHLAIAK